MWMEGARIKKMWIDTKRSTPPSPRLTFLDSNCWLNRRATTLFLKLNTKFALTPIWYGHKSSLEEKEKYCGRVFPDSPSPALMSQLPCSPEIYKKVHDTLFRYTQENTPPKCLYIILIRRCTAVIFIILHCNVIMFSLRHWPYFLYQSTARCIGSWTTPTASHYSVPVQQMCEAL